MTKIFKLVAIFVFSIPLLGQQCSTPQVTTFQDNTVTISYNCNILHPGQNSPLSFTNTLSTTILPCIPGVICTSIAERFSSMSVTYQTGYFLFGNPSTMSTQLTLPDTGVSPNPQYSITGIGNYHQTITGNFFVVLTDPFRISQDVELTSYIVANCYSYCGYSVVITLTP